MLSDQAMFIMGKNDDRLILFDDTQTIRVRDGMMRYGTIEIKARFIENLQTAGILIDSIDMDDFMGSSCSSETYPITRVVSQIFSQNAMQSTSGRSLTSSAQTINESPCSKVTETELVADPIDCRFYYVCRTSTMADAVRFQCPEKMAFSQSIKACTEQSYVSIFFFIVIT